MAVFDLGVALDGQGDVEGARAAYEQAIASGYPEASQPAAVNLRFLLKKQDAKHRRAVYQQAIDSGHPDQAQQRPSTLGSCLKSKATWRVRRRPTS